MVVRGYGRQVSSTLTGRWAGTRLRVRNDDATADGSTPLALPRLASAPMRAVQDTPSPETTNAPTPKSRGVRGDDYLAAAVAAVFFAAGFVAAVF